MNKVFYLIMYFLTQAIFAYNSEYLLDGVAPQVRIEVELEAKSGPLIVNSDRIYLGEIFECFSSDRVCEKIHGVDLGEAPKPKKVARLSGEDLKEIIESDLNSHYLLSITIPEMVQVKSAYQKLDDSFIEKEIEANFNSLELGGTKYSLRGFSFSRGQLIYPGEVNFNFIQLRKDVENFLKGSDRNYLNVKVSLNVISISNGSKVNSYVPVTLFFKKYEKAVFAGKNLRKGVLIKESDVYSGWKASTSRKAVSHTGDIIGRTARRNISEATPIYDSDFEKPKLIKKREEINAILADSGLQLQAKAIALESGGIGDKISIKLLATNKKLRARVVSAKSVKVIR